MSIVTGTFSIVCDKSGERYDFTPEDADFECVGGGERQMGSESQYSWSTDFIDEKSGDNIVIEYDVWEYPVGAFNHEEIKVEGGRYIETFSYNFHDDTDFEEDRPIDLEE